MLAVGQKQSVSGTLNLQHVPQTCEHTPYISYRRMEVPPVLDLTVVQRKSCSCPVTNLHGLVRQELNDVCYALVGAGLLERLQALLQ